MAVTNYYSLDDGIVGEETGGTRRDYLTDALGSVTATVTSAGSVENTYRYKPYGETLAKTGVGSDPKFLWVGTWGYRAESSSGTFYVRARTYHQASARWTSLDPIQSGYNWYAYCENNPVNSVDPDGTDDQFDKIYKNNIVVKIEDTNGSIKEEDVKIALEKIDKTPLGHKIIGKFDGKVIIINIKPGFGDATGIQSGGIGQMVVDSEIVNFGKIQIVGHKDRVKIPLWRVIAHELGHIDSGMTLDQWGKLNQNEKLQHELDIVKRYENVIAKALGAPLRDGYP